MHHQAMQFEKWDRGEEASGVTTKSALIPAPISGSPTQMSLVEHFAFLTVSC